MSHVLVLCARRYNGHELWTLLGTLKNRAHTFEVVSTSTLIKDELTFRPNKIARTVYDVLPYELTHTFNALSVVSGNMADTEAYWDDKHVQILVQENHRLNHLTAAICCSVPTLAPISRDIKISFFPLVRSRHRLERYGAILQSVSLTVDKTIITAENQMITQMWAEEISNYLEGLPPSYQLHPSNFTPKGRPRRMPKEVEAAIQQAHKNNKTKINQ